MKDKIRLAWALKLVTYTQQPQQQQRWRKCNCTEHAGGANMFFCLILYIDRRFRFNDFHTSSSVSLSYTADVLTGAVKSGVLSLPWSSERGETGVAGNAILHGAYEVFQTVRAHRFDFSSGSNTRAS